MSTFQSAIYPHFINKKCWSRELYDYCNGMKKINTNNKLILLKRGELSLLRVAAMRLRQTWILYSACVLTLRDRDAATVVTKRPSSICICVFCYTYCSELAQITVLLFVSIWFLHELFPLLFCAVVVAIRRFCSVAFSSRSVWKNKNTNINSLIKELKVIPVSQCGTAKTNNPK